jgi:hypothetical protein
MLLKHVYSYSLYNKGAKIVLNDGVSKKVLTHRYAKKEAHRAPPF